MFTFESTGDFRKTERWLSRLSSADIFASLENAGREGVAALRANTPRESGLAAESWSYEVSKTARTYSITWYNNNVENGFQVAIALQYGYGTGTGGFVQGRDYINPAMQPIFDKIRNDVWKAVTSV